MKGTSKERMGATLVMVVTLAIVLGLILVLLAELYCSLLLCRRQHKPTATPTPSLTLQRPPAVSRPPNRPFSRRLRRYSSRSEKLPFPTGFFQRRRLQVQRSSTLSSSKFSTSLSKTKKCY